MFGWGRSKCAVAQILILIPTCIVGFSCPLSAAEFLNVSVTLGKRWAHYFGAKIELHGGWAIYDNFSDELRGKNIVFRHTVWISKCIHISYFILLHCFHISNSLTAQQKDSIKKTTALEHCWTISTQHYP